MENESVRERKNVVQKSNERDARFREGPFYKREGERIIAIIRKVAHAPSIDTHFSSIFYNFLVANKYVHLFVNMHDGNYN